MPELLSTPARASFRPSLIKGVVRGLGHGVHDSAIGSLEWYSCQVWAFSSREQTDGQIIGLGDPLIPIKVI